MDSKTPSSSAAPPKPDLTNSGYSPNATWSNLFNAFLGRMSPRGMDEYREATYLQNSLSDQKNCEEWRDWCFTYSPTVIFLRSQINKLNGDMNSTNVICRRCPARRDEEGKLHQQGGGFNPEAGILICSNQMRDRKHLEDTLAHELVHAWDQLRWKVDWDDLRHAACSEIRASSLSGECRFTREFFTRGQRTLTQQHQACVRRRAVASVMARPNCKDDVQAVKVVNEVWDSCFSDTRPFDDIYR